MKKIKKQIVAPREAEYEELTVYDNLDEYLNDYNDGNYFIRIGYEDWEETRIDGKTYYSFSRNSNEMYLTEKVYKELLSHCYKTFVIRECNLLRTQKHSNTRYASESSVEEVIQYMKDEKKSWLPQICKEIDLDIKKLNDEIAKIQIKINQLENDKSKICDDEYLKSKIEIEYRFDSKKYREEIIENE